MNHQISLSVNGIAPKDLCQYLAEDDSLRKDNFQIYIPLSRGENSTNQTVIAAYVAGGTSVLIALITSLTNIYIAHRPKQPPTPVENENIVIIIKGDENSAELKLTENENISEEKLQIKLNKIGAIRKISITPK